MFHSNQVLDLTVELDDLPDAIRFIMSLYGTDTFVRRESPVKLAFAEPAPGMYAIGSGSFPGFPDRHIPGHPASRGWTDYPFDYDPAIVAQIINQWVKKQPEPPHTDTDGGESLGVRIRSLHTAACSSLPVHSLAAKWEPFWCIAVFEPCYLAFDK